MDFKNFLNNLTKYKKDYNFTIMNDKFDNVSNPSEEVSKIFSNINENLEFLKSKYNTLLNTDVIIREFNMFVYNQNHKCFIICIDGLVDAISINNFILEPLMSGKLRFNKPIENPAEAKTTLQGIKQQIKSLGNINLNAVDEYKEVKERYEFLSAQQDDILKAKQELTVLISEMTEIMTEMFLLRQWGATTLRPIESIRRHMHLRRNILCLVMVSIITPKMA